jgi:hypothetical protein
MSKGSVTPYTEHSATHYMIILSFQEEEISKKLCVYNGL